MQIWAIAIAIPIRSHHYFQTLILNSLLQLGETDEEHIQLTNMQVLVALPFWLVNHTDRDGLDFSHQCSEHRARLLERNITALQSSADIESQYNLSEYLKNKSIV